MKKKSLLWISALLLILAGCSSDDDALNNEITINEKNILGYWESTASSKGGLKFVSVAKSKNGITLILDSIRKNSGGISGVMTRER